MLPGNRAAEEAVVSIVRGALGVVLGHDAVAFGVQPTRTALTLNDVVIFSVRKKIEFSQPTFFSVEIYVTIISVATMFVEVR